MIHRIDLKIKSESWEKRNLNTGRKNVNQTPIMTKPRLAAPLKVNPASTGLLKTKTTKAASPRPDAMPPNVAGFILRHQIWRVIFTREGE